MKTEIKLLFCGDIHIAKNKYVLSDDLVKFFNGYDYCIANLEAPILSAPEDKDKLPKAGPNLSQDPDNFLEVIQKLNIKFLGASNNHISDYGLNGIYSTKVFCSKNNIQLFGVGKDINEASKAVYISNNIVILAVAEDEFGIAENNSFGSYSMYNNALLKTISDFSLDGKVVIVFAHGGGEEVPLPSFYIRDRYKQFIDSGASIVVGHHPHIPQGFEEYNMGKIYYSLGNFIHASYKKSYGNILELVIKQNRIIKEKLHTVDVNLKSVVIRREMNNKEVIYRNLINQILRDETKYKLLLNIQSVDMFNSYYKNYFSRMDIKNNNADLLLLSVLIRNNSHREFILNAISVLTNGIGYKNNIVDNLKYRQLKSFIKSKLS